MKESLLEMMGRTQSEKIPAEVNPLQPSPEKEEDREKYETLIKEYVESLPVIPVSSSTALRIFTTHHEDLVNDYLFKLLKVAVVEELPEVVLFRVGESEIISIIEWIDYGTQLEALLKYFVKVEDFEKAHICQKLITKYNVDRVIEESMLM